MLPLGTGNRKPVLIGSSQRQISNRGTWLYLTVGEPHKIHVGAWLEMPTNPSPPPLLTCMVCLLLPFFFPSNSAALSKTCSVPVLFSQQGLKRESSLRLGCGPGTSRWTNQPLSRPLVLSDAYSTVLSVPPQPIRSETCTVQAIVIPTNVEGSRLSRRDPFRVILQVQ